MSAIFWKNDLIEDFGFAGPSIGAVGLSSIPEAARFNAGAAFATAVSYGAGPMAKSPDLKTLVNFTGVDGEDPNGGLIADPSGDLFGTTFEGGANNAGTVFEIVRTQNGYAGTPTTLVSFTGYDGAFPDGALMANAVGDLVGTTTSEIDGPGDSTVFEVTHGGYAPPTARAAPTHAAEVRLSRQSGAFVQAMASHGPRLSVDTKPTFLAWRSETSTLIAGPKAT